uniref:Uncharacterized protein n=1 Tax=Panagrolaimus davidi TaxID=227884 RepID=A0A914PZ17_9BILA
MVANLGKNDDTNLWHELFTLQIFSTPQRVKILYQLLTKSINICNFLNDFIALVIDLFSITQCAACLFIKDYNDLKKIDSNLALVVIEAVNRVRDLTPEMRSQLVFKFQIRIYQFLEKFEHSNISPEAHAFVSSLSWDAKTLSDSRDLPKGYLPISEPMNPSVEKIFKKSLKHLNKSGVIKVKGWSYNFAKSVLQSNFMTTIIRDSENLEKKVQEAFLAEIIPTLLKLALSLPHLFVASDPYHQLELIPTLFEDSAPILNKANEDIHEQMIVPFMPFATIMESIKRHNSPSTESLLKSSIQAERRRSSNKLLYEKIHREYVRRQMAKSDIEKFQNDEDKLDLKHLHSMASKLFTTKSLEVPPKIIAGIKEGDREAVSTEKVFRSKMMDACCNVLKTILDSITIEQKLEFMIDHPLLNEKLKIADILNVHQFGKDSLGCFTAFIGLLSLPNNKILGDPKSSTFFNAIKQRRDAIFYFALKNSALIKNNKPTVSTEILEKDIPIYDILMKIFLTAEMKRNLCCPDNVSTYLYFALIINDISNVDIEIASEHLFEECGINENQVPFFATFNYANDLEAKIEKLFNDELETLVKDISSRISVAGIPRIIYDQLINCQTKINELKCLVIQLVATFWNPQKLLYAVGITLECRKKLEIGIEEIAKLLITGFYHLGKRTVKVEDLEAMILEEMDHIRGECLMSFQNSSLYGLILHIQQLFGFGSVVSALLIVLYVFTISNEKQLYAHRISLAFQISRESNLLKIFGLKNSEFGSIGIIDKKHQVVEMEKLFEEDYILHAAEVDPSIFFMFLDKPFNIQYKELMFALQSECNGIKHRFQFRVNNQRLRYHPKNIIQREPASDTPLIGKFPKDMFFKSTTKEVPANFCYPR